MALAAWSCPKGHRVSGGMQTRVHSWLHRLVEYVVMCARRRDVDAIGPAPKADVPPARALRECVIGGH